MMSSQNINVQSPKGHRQVTATGPANRDDDIVTFVTTGGAITFTLVSAQQVPGQSLTLKSDDTEATGNAVTVLPAAGETIDAAVSIALDEDQAAVVLRSDGTSWRIASSNTPAPIDTRSWSFQTNTTTGYAGGFYQFAASDNDFSPSTTFGGANVAVGAHFFIVVGASTVDVVTVRVTGTSVDDNGVRSAGATSDITLPTSTAVDTYFETSEKWIGQVTIEAVSGTAVTCNYGWAKYHDANNQDFTLKGLETLWESDSTDNTSDIELFHHKATGWTFNGGSTPGPPTAIAQRSVDYSTENDQQVGPGAWKRADFSLLIDGSNSEGLLFRITSGNTGIGTLSFRSLSLEISLRIVSP